MKTISFRIALALVCAFSAVGCSQGRADYTDVGGEAAYKGLIGKQFVTLRALHVLGVTMDPNYKKEVDLYMVVPAPGISGPEVLSDTPLPSGSVVTVIGFLECANCFFKDLRAVISLQDEVYAGKPVHLASLADEKLFTDSSGAVLMSPRYFAATKTSEPDS